MSIFGNGLRRNRSDDGLVPENKVAQNVYQQTKEVNPFSGRDRWASLDARNAFAVQNEVNAGNRAFISDQPNPNMDAGSLSRTQHGGLFDRPAQEMQGEGLARKNNFAEAGLRGIESVLDRIRERGREYGVVPFSEQQAGSTTPAAAPTSAPAPAPSTSPLGPTPGAAGAPASPFWQVPNYTSAPATAASVSPSLQTSGRTVTAPQEVQYGLRKRGTVAYDPNRKGNTYGDTDYKEY